MKNFYLEHLLLGIVIIFVALFTLYHNISHSYSQHFSVQAFSLAKGHYDLVGNFKEKYLDTDIIKNKYYYAADPGTALFMLPLAVVFSVNEQIPPQWIANILAIVLIVWILNKHFNLEKIASATTRIWLMITFLFATSVVSVIFIPNSWNLPQTVALVLSLLYIYIFRTSQKLYLLIPLVVITAFTRKQLLLPFAIIPISDFLLSLNTFLNAKLKSKVSSQKPARQQLIGKFIFTLLILISIYTSYRLRFWWYHTRFSDNLKEGYLTKSYNLDYQTVLLQTYGQFNRHFIPKNIYTYLLKSPAPVLQTDKAGSSLKWPLITPEFEGIGFFYLSPIFLAFFFLQPPKTNDYVAYLASAGGLLYLYLIFFTSGETQFGLRYSADLIPFLFIPLVQMIKNNFSSSVKLLILLSVIFNAFLLTSFFASGKTL